MLQALALEEPVSQWNSRKKKIHTNNILLSQWTSRARN